MTTSDAGWLRFTVHLKAVAHGRDTTGVPLPMAARFPGSTSGVIQYWSRVEKTRTPAALGFEVEVGPADEEVDDVEGAEDKDDAGALLDVGGTGTLALVNQTGVQ